MSLPLQIALTIIVPGLWGWGMYYAVQWLWPVPTIPAGQGEAPPVKKLPDYHI
jgi:hypothetical protein